MDSHLLEDVIRLPPGVLSPTARHVALVLAWHSNAGTGACYPSIKTLADETGRTRRTIITAIGELERAGCLTKTNRKTRAGTGRNYILSFNIAKGEAIAPIGGPNGETIALNRCNNFTSNGETIAPEIEKEIKGKCVCGETPHGTHTISKITLVDLPGIAKRINIPLHYVRWRFDELEAAGWTLENGKRITPAGFPAHVQKWYRCEPRTGRPIYPDYGQHREPQQQQPKQYAPDDWTLCQERCANFKAGQCVRGCKIPPPQQERPIPPEECRGFSKLHAKG